MTTPTARAWPASASASDECARGSPEVPERASVAKRKGSSSCGGRRAPRTGWTSRVRCPWPPVSSSEMAPWKRTANRTTKARGGGVSSTRGHHLFQAWLRSPFGPTPRAPA
eukprot:CAMPEP_0182555182 /NCGR_PEP_ID=MMETSP1323-20130603/50361_1 /TAXON_ID=236787 /ORGANISM="Florenciella parvula, Strain RCC1693" /LENGTH=110 /DNA_ID=CAMNT_0024766911 /DNA_START=493 /DNA_END=825 /DNA_ORIENTATION=+